MIKIGIVFPPIKGGGVFQYALTILESFSNHSQRFQGLSLDFKEKSFFRRILYFSNLILNGKLFFLKDSYSNSKVDLLIFPTPFSFELPSKIPYIVAIPDLMHRYYPSFPEYYCSGPERCGAAIDKSLLRPAPTGLLIGDISKAKRVFGFEPKVKFKELVKIMLEADIKALDKK